MPCKYLLVGYLMHPILQFFPLRINQILADRMRNTPSLAQIWVSQPVEPTIYTQTFATWCFASYVYCETEMLAEL